MTSLAFPYRRWPRWRASVSKHLSFFFLFILYFLPKHRLLQLTTTICKLIVLEICNFIISLVSLQLSFFFFVSNNLCYHYCMFLYHNDRTIISGLCIKIYWCFFFYKRNFNFIYNWKFCEKCKWTSLENYWMNGCGFIKIPWHQFWCI